jgi:hypothetical protein
MKSKTPRLLVASFVFVGAFVAAGLTLAQTPGKEAAKRSAGAASSSAVQAQSSSFKCLAAASIVWKFSQGDQQLANVRDDSDFQALSASVINRQQARLSALSQDEQMAGMNAVVAGEAQRMSDAVFAGVQGNLAPAEMGQRLKSYMTRRFDVLRCLKG